ncbi:MAG: hypothetical protein IPJ07_07135 [Acidobacteria bacterium]|nr:hypothetical protein [Acidobacteriota bacterium]
MSLLTVSVSQSITAGGEIKHHPQFGSKLIDARNVDVWLPPGYDGNKARRYPVLYMHDGQNIFDGKSALAG